MNFLLCRSWDQTDEDDKDEDETDDDENRWRWKTMMMSGWCGEGRWADHYSLKFWSWQWWRWKQMTMSEWWCEGVVGRYFWSWQRWRWQRWGWNGWRWVDDARGWWADPPEVLIPHFPDNWLCPPSPPLLPISPSSSSSPHLSACHLPVFSPSPHPRLFYTNLFQDRIKDFFLPNFPQ